MRRLLAFLGLLALPALLLVLRCATENESEPSPRGVSVADAALPTDPPDAAERPERIRVRRDVTEAQPTVVPAAGTGQVVVVRTVNEQGAAIQGARVTLDLVTSLMSGPPESAGTLVTDGSGEARFSITAQRASATIRAVGEDSFGELIHRVPNGDPAQPIEIVLRPGAVIRGRVELPDGSPGAGARLSLAFAWGPGGAERSTKSDDAGDFEFRAFDANDLRRCPIVIAVLGNARTSRYVFDERPVLLRLDNDVALHGSVVNDAGLPVEGATVHSTRGRLGRTDANGDFLGVIAESLQARAFVLKVGYPPVAVATTSADDGRRTLGVVVLRRGGEIRGQVTDAGGTAVRPQGSGVWLCPEGTTTRLAGVGVSEDGTFAMPCGPGRWDIVLEPDRLVTNEGVAPLLGGVARGVTAQDDVFVTARVLPQVRVAIRTEPPLGPGSRHLGRVGIAPRGAGMPTASQMVLTDENAALRVTGPAGPTVLVLDFGAAGHFVGEIDVPAAGAIEREVVLVPASQ